MKKSIFIFLILGLFSCENWLNVTPKSQVNGEDLFSSESGFKTALFGIYTSMVGTPLYGEELSMSLLDAMAQYYNISSSYHNYSAASTYAYDDMGLKSKTDAIWGGMYQTIMNCNNLLENMEGKENLFAGKHYQLIRGEALGIRAYLHFDLLRLYAPSFAVGNAVPAIPYVDKVSRSPFEQLTNTQVVDRIMEDCQTALVCLEDSDPFGPAGVGQSENEEMDKFLEKRQERMNYYAVKALMARVRLYQGDKEEAERLTEELIAVKELGKTDAIFQLYSDKVVKYSDNFFNASLQNNQKLIINQVRRGEYYEVSSYKSFDSRITSWLMLEPGGVESAEGPNSTGIYLVSKYAKILKTPEDIPLIRMPEVYYINAECKTSPADALARLNTVRNAYGITTGMDLKPESCDWENELFKEYRKTFLAEGQLFYFMKRRDFEQIPNASMISEPRKIFCLPLPDGELEFGKLIK